MRTKQKITDIIKDILLVLILILCAYGLYEILKYVYLVADGLPINVKLHLAIILLLILILKK